MKEKIKLINLRKQIIALSLAGSYLLTGCSTVGNNNPKNEEKSHNHYYIDHMGNYYVIKECENNDFSICYDAEMSSKSTLYIRNENGEYRFYSFEVLHINGDNEKEFLNQESSYPLVRTFKDLK